MAELFALEDEIAESVVAAVEPSSMLPRSFARALKEIFLDCRLRK
jgi:hypothetical protein